MFFFIDWKLPPPACPGTTGINIYIYIYIFIYIIYVSQYIHIEPAEHLIALSQVQGTGGPGFTTFLPTAATNTPEQTILSTVLQLKSIPSWSPSASSSKICPQREQVTMAWSQRSQDTPSTESGFSGLFKCFQIFKTTELQTMYQTSAKITIQQVGLYIFDTIARHHS